MGDASNTNRAGANGQTRGVQTASRRGDDWLKSSLSRVYEQDAAEPIPEEWLRLLGKLNREPGDA